MSLVCITNDVPELRPCVVPDEHRDGCDGFARRYDRDLEKRVATDQGCKGCLPSSEGMVGLVCWSCYEKLRDGMSMAVDVITHLRSIESAAQADNAGIRGSSGWIIPIPSTWRAADDLIVLLGHPTPGFPSDAGVWEVEAITERYVDAYNPAMAVGRVWPAEDAVRFIATMHSALIQHPMEDYEHRVRNVRCPKCRQRSLLWKPPLMFEGKVQVECRNEECLFVLNQGEYAFLAFTEVKLVQEDERIKRVAKRTADRVKAKAAKAAANAIAKQEREEEEERSAAAQYPSAIE